ncbi:MAG: protoheme IX farnesyltransferase [Chloroflexi bacterium]|nr:protoheme IX farnesyltransferase [Chloroflexota bacterium]
MKPTSFGDTLKIYLELTKLRIVLLLVFTTVTAMFIAAEGAPSFAVLVPTIIGGALAAGGSSVINQYYDRDMDAKMTRTARRPIPSGRVSPTNALIFGVALIVWSVFILGVFVNWLAAGLALGGSLYYVVIYTVLLKRNTVLNILIGGGAGAMPVLVGWAAVTGTLNVEAWLLFAIVFYWTPPHSWALALLVNTDYARANVPMMPVARGEAVTRQQILLYAIMLLLISLLPFAFGTLGAIYGMGAVLLGIGLIRASVNLIKEKTGAAARSTYKFSTAYLAFLFLIMIIDTVIL